MPSKMRRLGLVAVVGTVLAGAIAVGQDPKPIERARAGGVAVFNPVEGRMVVASAKPDGSQVEIGDVVCEFDSGELRDRLASQALLVSGALAEVRGTTIAREVAELSLREYEEGSFRQQFATTESHIKLTESKLASAEDHMEWSRRMFQKGYASLAEKVSDELALRHARFALEEAQSKKKVLLDYSKAKTIKALTGAIESARARELTAQAVLERERALQKKLADQIGRCKIKAPAAGRLEYAAPVGAGAVVQDGQLILRVFTDVR
jgi:HlyD family secretion protein